MTVLPFISLGIGISLGLLIKSATFISISDKISTVALILLMLSIGIGIGLDESIMANFLEIGLNCVIIALSAIFFSIIFMLLCEKTVIPLKKLDAELEQKNIDLNSMDHNITSDGDNDTEKKKGSSLVWMMPCSVVAGLICGIVFRNNINSSFIDLCFTGSLILLYICVGIMQGANKGIFKLIRKLGLKILLIPGAIMAGSITGGIISGLILGLPMEISLISSSGMSFYSITGAFMTETYGIETGTYGFIVNIMREFFTVLLMPLLIKISPGSPIAGGAAGNMDTMLAPITKFVGVRLGLVTLITGILLTFAVPVILPIIASII